jgi:hypothetical protein
MDYMKGCYTPADVWKGGPIVVSGPHAIYNTTNQTFFFVQLLDGIFT